MSSQVSNDFTTFSLLGSSAVHVLSEQGLQKDHLSQLAPWLQRWTNHVHITNGMNVFTQHYSLNLRLDPVGSIIWVELCVNSDRAAEAILHRFGGHGYDHCWIPTRY